MANTDFNDLANSGRGMESVRKQLLAAMGGGAPVTNQEDKDEKKRDIAAITALREDYERKIRSAELDFEELVYKLVPEIQDHDVLPPAVKELLLKLAAKTAGISRDVLMSGWTGEAAAKADGSGGNAALLEQLNRDHAIVPVGGGVYVANMDYDPMLDKPVFSFSSPAAFELRYRNNKVFAEGRSVGAGEWWLDHADRRQYKGLVFSPDREMPGYLNMWMGWGVQPYAGECSAWLEFTYEIICNKDGEKFDYLMRYFAHMVQKPRELPETAIVFRGEEGVGKNTFFAPLIEIVGKAHFIMLTSLEQVAGRFTGHLVNVLFVLCNESIWGGDKKSQGVLKSLITDDNQPVERKGVEIGSAFNCKRVAFSTNETWAVPRGGNDRRNVIFDISNAKAGNWEYWKAIKDEFANGGAAALFDLLMKWDINDWHPRMIPAELKENGWEMKIRGFDSVEGWWMSVLQRGWTMIDKQSSGAEFGNDELWTPQIRTETLQTDYLRWCESYRKMHPEHPAVVGKALAKFGLTTGRPRQANPERKNMYIIPELPIARKRFAEMYQIPMEAFEPPEMD